MTSPAAAQLDSRLADPAPAYEALPGRGSFDIEPDGAHHDAAVQGAFVLDSVMALKSTRMPVLVDVFPKYSPRNAGSAWGQGWRSDALSIRRSQLGRAPRFDASDRYASRWGVFERGNNGSLYPRGLRSHVQAVFEHDTIKVTEPDGTVWVYDGAGHKTPLGESEKWLLVSVFDVFGNRVELRYGTDDNLEQAEWKRQGVLQHRVVVEYETARTFPVDEFIAGTRRGSPRRVRTLSVLNTDRNDGTPRLQVRYELHFDPSREWQLRTVTESRQGVSRTTGYTYGKPWADTNDQLGLRPLTVGDKLPLYPAEQAFMSLASGDVNGDGRVDFLQANDYWLIHQGAAGGYAPISYRSPTASSVCHAPLGSRPQLVPRHPGSDEPFAFRSLISQPPAKTEYPIPHGPMPLNPRPIDTNNSNWVPDLDRFRLAKFSISQCTLDGHLIGESTLELPKRTALATCQAIPTGPGLRDGKLPFSLVDLNSDGVPDLVVMDTCRMLVWQAGWKGDQLTFSASPKIVELDQLDSRLDTPLVDLNGDGLLDVIDYSFEQHAWFNRGVLSRTSLSDKAGPAFEAPVSVSPRSASDLAKGFGTLGPRLARLLMRLDNDPFIDMMEVWLADGEFHPPGPFTRLHIVLYRGTGKGFAKIREFDDDKWGTGWPLPLPISPHWGAGLAFVDFNPIWRTQCPEGALQCDQTCPAYTYPASYSGGGHGPKYYCTPRVFWSEVMGANADLIIRVDNQRGDSTDYEYGWGKFTEGFGRGPIVLTKRTRHIVGRSDFETQYSYEQPLLDSKWGMFAGFGRISMTDRQGSAMTATKPRVRTSLFELLADVVVPKRTDVQGSDGSVHTETQKYDLTAFRGVPLIRLSTQTSVRQVGAQSVELTQTQFLYRATADVCPRSQSRGGSGDTLTSVFAYAAVATPEEGWACRPKTITVAGVHRDASLNFTETSAFSYDARGMPFKSSATSGSTSVTTHTTVYAPNGNLISSATATGGATTFTSYKKSKVAGKPSVDLTLPERVVFPDGRIIEFDYDPVSDDVLTASASRIDSQTKAPILRRSARTYDPFGRVASESLWNQGDASPLPAWLLQNYREPTGAQLGARWTTKNPFLDSVAVPKAALDLELFDGAGETVARLHALSQKRWLIESATLEAETANEVVEWRGGELDLADHQIPSVFQLLNATGNVALSRRKRSLSSLETDETEYAGDVQAVRWKTIASLDNEGALSLHRTDDGPTKTRVQLQKFDALGRLVGVALAPERLATAQYDAADRLRRVHLPGGAEAAADYGPLGLLTEVRRDDMRFRYSYKPKSASLDCVATLRAGRRTVRECYEWNDAGSPTKRRTYDGDKLDDVVRWTYQSGSAFPDQIEGRGYVKTWKSDGVDEFGARWKMAKIKVFPTPEKVTDPPKHIETDATEITEFTHFSTDGAVSSTDMRIRKGGVELLGGGLTCNEKRDALGWREGWHCGSTTVGSLAIDKKRLPEKTEYTLSNGRKVVVTHADSLRRWTTLDVSDRGAKSWDLTRRHGAEGTFTEGFHYGSTRDESYLGYHLDGALHEVIRPIVNPSGTTTGTTREAYEYDAAGLLQSVESSGKPQVTVTRTPSMVSLGARQWVSDGLGRLHPAGVDVVWNAQNQAASASFGARRAVYLYDEANRRFLRAEQSTTTIWQEQTQVSFDNSAIPSQTRFRIPINFDGYLFAIATEKGFKSLDYDFNGTLVGVDGTAAKAETPFGVRGTHRLDVPEFGGGYYDDILGTVRFGVRDYIPELGQFSTKDPLFAQSPKLSLSDARSANLYTYAGGNPIDQRDPSGFETCPGPATYSDTGECAGGTVTYGTDNTIYVDGRNQPTPLGRPDGAAPGASGGGWGAAGPEGRDLTRGQRIGVIRDGKVTQSQILRIETTADGQQRVFTTDRQVIALPKGEEANGAVVDGTSRATVGDRARLLVGTIWAQISRLFPDRPPITWPTFFGARRS